MVSPLRRRWGRRTAEDAALTPPCFYGWTRFSMFQRDSTAWKASRQGQDEATYQAHLWSAERMGPRCDIFFDLSVPLLQRMADRHRYRHLVQYNDAMPEPWRGRLLSAARTHPVLLLVPIEGGLSLQGPMADDLRARSASSGPVTYFRVDDDDLLAVDFLDRLAAFSTLHDGGRAVSLASGYAALWHEGRVSLPRRTRRPLGSQGQAYVSAWDQEAGALNVPRPGDHSTIDQRMPTLLDSRAPAFMQLRHVGQDTHTNATEVEATLRRQLLGMRGVPERAEVLTAFPTLSPVLGEIVPAHPASQA